MFKKSLLNKNLFDYLLEKIGPPRVIMLSFLIVLLIGSVLLFLPAASDGPKVSYIDALFTATSAVCVTGLTVVNTFSQWSVFGKLVIMVLIQIGGLGFLTVITITLILAGRKITLYERVLIQASFNQLNLQGMVKFVITIVFGTLILETAGGILLTARFLSDGLPFVKALGYGFFHSVSAFCNAGFDIIGSDSLSAYINDPVINIVVLTLMITGSIGFAVWIDLINVFKRTHIRSRIKNFNIRAEISRLQLNTKIVFVCTGFLVIFGFVFFLASEYNNPLTIGSFPLPQKLAASIFMSVSYRTAGFSAINHANMEPISKFVTMILIFIGGSPSGTSGGVKTVTMAVVLLAVISVIRGKDTIEVFHKNIPLSLLQRSLAVIFLLLSIIITAAAALTFTERGAAFSYDFMDLLFEVVSAIGTGGLSMGIAPQLSTAGKTILSAVMFIGRLGPITTVIALSIRSGSTPNNIKYPDERVLIG